MIAKICPLISHCSASKMALSSSCVVVILFVSLGHLSVWCIAFVHSFCSKVGQCMPNSFLRLSRIPYYRSFISFVPFLHLSAGEDLFSSMTDWRLIFPAHSPKRSYLFCTVFVSLWSLNPPAFFPFASFSCYNYSLMP